MMDPNHSFHAKMLGEFTSKFGSFSFEQRNRIVAAIGDKPSMVVHQAITDADTIGDAINNLSGRSDDGTAEGGSQAHADKLLHEWSAALGLPADVVARADHYEQMGER